MEKDINKSNSWYNTQIHVDIATLIVTLVFFALMFWGVFYINFGTLNTSDVKYFEGIDIGANETVTYENYQNAYFVTKEQSGKLFTAKITNPSIVYTLGFLDKKLFNSEKRLEQRLINMEKENVLLRESVDKLIKVILEKN